MNDASPAQLTRKLVISPVLLDYEYIKDGRLWLDCGDIMSRFNNAVKAGPIGCTRGIFKATIESPHEYDDTYHSGQGMIVSIPEAYSADDMFEAINRGRQDKPWYVVYDPATGQHWGRPNATTAVPDAHYRAEFDHIMLDATTTPSSHIGIKKKVVPQRPQAMTANVIPIGRKPK